MNLLSLAVNNFESCEITREYYLNGVGWQLRNEYILPDSYIDLSYVDVALKYLKERCKGEFFVLDKYFYKYMRIHNYTTQLIESPITSDRMFIYGVEYVYVDDDSWFCEEFGKVFTSEQVKIMHENMTKYKPENCV